MITAVIRSATLVASLFVAAYAHAKDIERGKAAFRKCAACHAVDTTTNKVGPHLGDIMGRTAGTVEGFNFSPAMKKAGKDGLVWDETSLAEYLAAPKTKVPGTRMAFAGIRNDDELANLVTYLAALPELP
ncbi:MAG: c-type cytochrome [Neoaquamicrobium sediminum]|uniref:c-type cytochrome n=1 Tax=Neoaquamicrobium sediminum TaxID=1849104 RepID=UPI00403710A9